MAARPPATAALVDPSILQALLLHAPLAAAWVSAAGIVQGGNARFRALTGAGDDRDRSGQRMDQLFSSVGVRRWERLWRQLGEHGYLVSAEMLGHPPTAQAVELSLQQIEWHGQQWAALYLRDIGPEQHAESIRLLQHEVLEAVAGGEALPAVMDLLCQRVEALAPELLCSVLLVKGECLRTCAAPSLPKAFCEAIDGVRIGPASGSCGTAAWRGTAVEVQDIAHDPLWQDYRAFALPLGLAACWSSPIRRRNGRVAGTFALYYREVRGAGAFHREMVEACLHLAGLAIERAEAERQIHQLVFYDLLTGLANRTLLRDRSQQALSRATHAQRPLALICVGLDRFKTVNESLGHGGGDQLLRLVARRLESAVAPGDTVARLSGDEFVLLLPDTGAAQAGQRADQLLALLRQPVTIDGIELSLTASLGISVAPDDGVDGESLQNNASAAMHHAKALGRNRYQFFQARMNRSAGERLASATLLRRALADQALRVHYEPQVDISSGRVHGIEALVRWAHPQRGLVVPSEFVPLAEELGLIAAFDHWVLGEACRQLALWRAQGIAIGSISVNLSVAGFQHGDIGTRVSAVLQQENLAPQSLNLEITESFMLDSTDDTLRALRGLRALGVGLAIDDFGTGYSNLGYLKRFPVTTLKLDRSFLRDLGGDADGQALAAAIIQLGRVFHHTVIAEGVESTEQLQFLRAQGCTLAQGYLFTHPLPAAEMTRWLQRAPALLRGLIGA